MRYVYRVIGIAQKFLLDYYLIQGYFSLTCIADVSRDFKIQRRGRQQERQKNYRFN